MTWGYLRFGNYRNCGPTGRTLPYFYPIEWEGYGLNVAGKYGTNDNWLMKDNNNEEWCVMYYGTAFQSNHIEVCESYLEQKQIGNQKYIVVLQVRVRPEALRQVKKDTDILDLIVQHKKNNKNYDKSCDNMALWNNDYFVVNDTKDIRPYRILLKNITNTFGQKEQVDSLKNKENYEIPDPQKSSIQIDQFAILKNLLFKAKAILETVTQNKQHVFVQQETFQKQQQYFPVDQGGDILVVCANQIRCQCTALMDKLQQFQMIHKPTLLLFKRLQAQHMKSLLLMRR